MLSTYVICICSQTLEKVDKCIVGITIYIYALKMANTHTSH